MAEMDGLDIRLAGNGEDHLLPCPFCGSEDIAYGKYEHAAGPRWAVVCMGCMAQIDPGWAQMRHAVQELWNRRSKPKEEV